MSNKNTEYPKPNYNTEEMSALIALATLPTGVAIAFSPSFSALSGPMLNAAAAGTGVLVATGLVSTGLLVREFIIQAYHEGHSDAYKTLKLGDSSITKQDLPKPEIKSPLTNGADIVPCNFIPG